MQSWIASSSSSSTLPATPGGRPSLASDPRSKDGRGALGDGEAPRSGEPSSSPGWRSSFPQRPGAPVCDFFAKTGFCKYGASCKFDHPSRCAACSVACEIAAQRTAELHVTA